MFVDTFNMEAKTQTVKHYIIVVKQKIAKASKYIA